MVLNQAEVESKLASLITEGKVTCFKCGEHLKGADITGLDLVASDGKPKVFYICSNTYCGRHTVQGFRTLSALGIAEIVTIAAGSPLLAATPPIASVDVRSDVFDAEELEESEEPEEDEGPEEPEVNAAPRHVDENRAL
jgi:hypothetical protein